MFDHNTTLSFTVNSQADTTSKNITDGSASEKLIRSRLKSKKKFGCHIIISYLTIDSCLEFLMEKVNRTTTNCVLLLFFGPKLTFPILECNM